MTADDIRDLLAPHVAIALRRMFGGHGIYADGRIFGLEIEGEIFLKVDAQSRPFFEARGSGPFTYEKKAGQLAVMSYWQLPAEAYDDDDLLAQCIREALGAAARAGVNTKRKPTRRRALTPQ